MPDLGHGALRPQSARFGGGELVASHVPVPAEVATHVRQDTRKRVVRRKYLF